MLHPTQAVWDQWGVREDTHRFFALHWTELFDEETPDTWQVRTCNIKTLLREMASVAKIAEEFDPYRGVIRSLLDETLMVVKRDEILGHHFPFVKQYLEPWRKKEIGQPDLADVEHLAHVILGNLDRYWDRGVELLAHQLEAADPKRKKELYDATMNLGVETLARGHSARFLREEFIRVVLVPSSEVFPERVRQYFRSLAAGAKRYRCWVLTEGVKKQLASSMPSDIGLQFGRPASISPGAPDEFYKRVPKSGICLSVETTAADPEAARLVAERRLGQVFAGLCLFNIDDHIGLKQTSVLVVPEGNGDARLVERRRPGSHHLGSYEARQDRAEMLFRVQGRLGASDAAQLAAAVQYHRLALLATSDEAQLVNLWIALEALCQGGAGSIVERVCTRVAPCVAVDNLRKHLVSLAQYVREVWDDSDREQFLRLFPNSTATRLAPEDLLAVLLKPDGHSELKELCRLCHKHPLILHRLFRTRSMGLAKPKDVAANLTTSHQNVEWQLRRIYRVRNAIVHRGQGDVLLPQLTQHLHSYLVKTIRSILLELDGQPSWTIRDALEHRRKLFAHTVTFFTDTAGDTIGARTLLESKATMFPQEAPFAWPLTTPLLEDEVRSTVGSGS